MTKQQFYQLQDKLSQEIFKMDYNDLSRVSQDYINESIK